MIQRNIHDAYLATDDFGLMEDNLYDWLRVGLQYFPKVDRTAFFVCVSCVAVIIALIIIYWAIRIRSYRAVANDVVQWSAARMSFKGFLILIALTLIFFASWTKRRITMMCNNCVVEYSYTETRLFGKLIAFKHFQTLYPPIDLYEVHTYKGDLCRHSYAKSISTRYWGGVFPMLEYFYIVPEGGWAPSSLSDNSLREITRDMKFIYIRDETGTIVRTEVWQKGLPLPDQQTVAPEDGANR